MLCSTNPRLGDLLVSLLATTPSQNMHSLRNQLPLRAGGWTIQAIYRELRLLQSAGVVIKVRERYSLSLTWSLDLAKLVDTLHHSYFKAPQVSSIIPDPNEERSWVFHNLLKLDDFWVQIMWMLFGATGKRRLLNWAPHPWFYFAQSTKLDLFYRALVREKRIVNLIIGGETYLDHLFRAEKSKQSHVVALAPSVFPRMRTKHLQVIGDMVLTVTLEKRMSTAIDSLFTRIRSNRDLDYRAIFQLLNGSTRARIALRNDRVRAEKLRRKFMRFFGLVETDL